MLRIGSIVAEMARTASTSASTVMAAVRDSRQPQRAIVIASAVASYYVEIE